MFPKTMKITGTKWYSAVAVENEYGSVWVEYHNATGPLDMWWSPKGVFYPKGTTLQEAAEDFASKHKAE